MRRMMPSHFTFHIATGRSISSLGISYLNERLGLLSEWVEDIRPIQPSLEHCNNIHSLLGNIGVHSLSDIITNSKVSDDYTKLTDVLLVLKNYSITQTNENSPIPKTSYQDDGRINKSGLVKNWRLVGGESCIFRQAWIWGPNLLKQEYCYKYILFILHL